ncbi:DUF4179 domain-containing protein [Falsibacillus pallidus]|uniref:Uncharacterized protein DUF4179 n=1 Tax=Falsibacillus pallidus TaxID=493781 RepID=A0A370G2L5_9BACI|nr:DUF4179 domain-containing protein [Falsibacillus pallidus]RDI37256.1 uncharacterized protein DUF4179 [Falsibacillus pallidus]
MSEVKKLVDISIDDIEPVAVSELEKRRVKQHVLGRKKKRKPYQGIAAAAVIVIGAGIAGSFAAPSLATQIPIIHNIMSYFTEEDSYNENFAKVAADISQTQTSNGVSVMIEDAAFDGSSITVSYAIQTDKELGETPYLKVPFDVKGSDGMGSSGRIEKINENTYVGTEKITPHFKGKTPDSLVMRWEPKAFVNMKTNESVKGDWKFAFNVRSLENKKVVVNQTTEANGVSVLIQSLETNDLSTIIHYSRYVDDKAILEKWPDVSVEIKSAVDDLGNSYKVDSNGGISRDNGISFDGSSTIKSVDPKAKSLIVVPVIYFSKGSGDGLETKEMDPIQIELK